MALACALPAIADDDGEKVSRRAATPQLELKRAMSNRGSTEENTRTTFRAELILDSVVALLRLDVPFVDKNNEFASDPANAGLGDLKARVGFAPVRIGSIPLRLYSDVVFPTAEAKLGGGKWQLGPGVSTILPLPSPWSGAPMLVFLPLVEHYVSIAGDAARKDVNYTKLEAKIEARWPGALLSANAKPVLDWTQDASAAVLEVQGTWLFAKGWRAWLKVGRRLWGEGLPTTYEEQVELGVRWTL